MTDTLQKRMSAINVGSPWRGLFPYPDGTATIDQADEQQIAFMYSGILAGEPVPPTPSDGGADYIIIRRRRRGR